MSFSKFARIMSINIVWITAISLECNCVYLAISLYPSDIFNKISLANIFFFHLSSSFLLLAIPFYYAQKDRRNINLYLYLFEFLSLILPLIGIIGSSFVYFFTRKILKPKGIVEANDQTTNSNIKNELQSNPIIMTDTFLKEELRVEPIIDILSGKDNNLKAGAIKFIEKSASPGLISIVKSCLTDPNHEIRYYAHSTITALNKKHLDRIKEAQSAIISNDNQATDHKYLGQTYKDYAESNLLEDEIINYYLKLSETSFQKALSKNTDDPEVFIKLGQLSINKKSYEEAEIYFSKAMKMAEDPIDPLLGLCEVYYETKDTLSLSKSVKHMSRFKDQQIKDINKNILMQFWTNSTKVRAYERVSQ